jgi:signal transduction histidine kinase/CheY-like chemotaxis protein
MTDLKATGFIVGTSEVQAQLTAELASAELLQNISTQLIPENSVKALYEKIVDAAVMLMRSDYGTMQRLYPQRGRGGQLRLLAYRGFSPQAAEGWRWVPAHAPTTCCAALRTGKRVIVHDFEQCDFMAGTEALTAHLQVGIRAAQSTPLISRRGKMVGMITTHWREPHTPSERDIRLLDVLARQAADLLERSQTEARLRKREEELQTFAERLEGLVKERTQELQASKERLRALATELTLTEQRERQRLATDLHDHLQQLLVLGKLKLGQGKRVAHTPSEYANVMDQVDNVLSEALQYTRSLVADLSPPVLRDHGLLPGLKWLGETMKKHDLAVTINVPEGDELKLSKDQGVLLFQSVRELLINASKYAGTGQATVTLERRNGGLSIVVRDEGNGFDLAAPPNADVSKGTVSSKFGLFSIGERMKALGGTCEVVSAPGQGTTATLTLPCTPTVESEGRNAASREPAINLQASADLARSGLRAEKAILPKHAPIRVLLVDDHAMMRQGLRTVLDGYVDVEVVGEAQDGHQAIAAVEELRPTVVVMDLQMPNKNGFEATAAIKARHPDIIIIGLSVNADADNAEAMRKAGAAMLLTKEAAVNQLYTAIQQTVCENIRRFDRCTGSPAALTSRSLHRGRKAHMR